MEKKLIILNEEGLHARPAGIFAKKAAEFKSNIQIKTTTATKNGKSIMSLMSLGLKVGDSFILEAIGEDDELALNSLADLVENKFQI